MITIKMDDHSIHQFSKEEYTTYDITSDFVVVKNGEQWIGIFSRDHFISLVCDDKNE